MLSTANPRPFSPALGERDDLGLKGSATFFSPPSVSPPLPVGEFRGCLEAQIQGLCDPKAMRALWLQHRPQHAWPDQNARSPRATKSLLSSRRLNATAVLQCQEITLNRVWRSYTGSWSAFAILNPQIQPIQQYAIKLLILQGWLGNFKCREQKHYGIRLWNDFTMNSAFLSSSKNMYNQSTPWLCEAVKLIVKNSQIPQCLHENSTSWQDVSLQTENINRPAGGRREVRESLHRWD